MPRIPEQNRQKAMGVLTCIRLDLGAAESMLEYLSNLVPGGPHRNAITKVNIDLQEIRNKLAKLNLALGVDDDQ